MLPTTLTDWLDYQQRIHPQAIALGLDRVREVWTRLGAPAPAPVVITVGGTNGKGSTVAFLDAMLAADGKRVGAYTSPHLLRYNERVRVAGSEVEDERLLDAFQRIEQARGDIQLTYFEYGTLAALWVFSRASLDVAVLEVGLGGRHDAVNIVDADAAIVTTIDLDHQDWLGDDRASIGREKAGIFRHGRAAIVGDADPPASLIAEAQQVGARLYRVGHEFNIERIASGWRWSGWSDPAVDRADSAPGIDLPTPGLSAPYQAGNLACAVAALFALRDKCGWNPQAIRRGAEQARVQGRMQRFPGRVELVVDVAHNPQAARALAAALHAQPAPGRTFAVFGALADKDVAGVVAALTTSMERWFLAGLDRESPRGLTGEALIERLVLPVEAVSGTFADIDSALDAAFAEAQAGDRIVAFGSFFVAAAALQYARAQGLDPASA